MKIVAISDLHNNFIKTLPDGDILLIAGDFTGSGKAFEIEKFNEFLGKFRTQFKEIIITPGNHDFLFEEDFPRASKLITNGRLLMNEVHTLYNGMTIFGSPVTPWFHDWAFNVRSYEDRMAIWKQIPDNIDIVMTHGPAFGILDKTISGNLAGCDALRDRLNKLSNVKLHVFGHIHEAYGIINRSELSTYIAANVSLCSRYPKDGLHAPMVITLDD